MSKTYLFISYLLWINICNAQFCGTDFIQSSIKAEDKNYQKVLEKSHQRWVEGLAEKSIVLDHENRISYEIPVVIHVLHNGEPIGHANNPSDETLYLYVDYLNRVFAAQWSKFYDTTEGGVYIPIKFVLAKRTPGCNPTPTNGITRFNLGAVYQSYFDDGLTYDGTGLGIDDITLKSFIHWPSEEYYNIYLVHTLHGAGGYAYYPLYYSFLDGTVMNTSYSYQLQQLNDYYYAFPHELGHGFALPHTFEGDNNSTSCPDDYDCNYDGDGICDTEPHINEGNTKCASGINPCTDNNYDGVQYNIMNYTGCPKKFTPLQKDKVLYTLINHRAGLLNSLGATAIDHIIQLTPANCTGTTLETDPYYDIGSYNIEVNQQRISTLGYKYESYQGYKNFSCNQKPFKINLNGTNFLNVSTYNEPQQVKVYIDYNNNGSFESNELVLHDNGNNDNYYDFNSHSIQFSVPNTATTCTYLRMRVITDTKYSPEVFPCNSVYEGQIEDFAVMISPNPLQPLLTITTNEDIYCVNSSVTFQTNLSEGVPTNYEWVMNGQSMVSNANASSYTLNVTNNLTEVICYVSYTDECGTTQTVQSNIVHLNSNTLHASIKEVTQKLIASPTGSKFTWIDCNTNEVLQSSNSATYNPAQSGSYKVIANKNGCSDTSDCFYYQKVGIEDIASSFEIFPNPSDGAFTIQLQSTYSTIPWVTITDITGKIVHSQQLNPTQTTIQMSVAQGIYFVTVHDENSSSTEKLIVR